MSTGDSLSTLGLVSSGSVSDAIATLGTISIEDLIDEASVAEALPRSLHILEIKSGDNVQINLKSRHRFAVKVTPKGSFLVPITDIADYKKRQTKYETYSRIFGAVVENDSEQGILTMSISGTGNTAYRTGVPYSAIGYAVRLIAALDSIALGPRPVFYNPDIHGPVGSDLVPVVRKVPIRF